jgi:hypothetical protein
VPETTTNLVFRVKIFRSFYNNSFF